MTKTRTEAFRDWLETATTGQVYTYYTGFLSSDRGVIVDYGDGDTKFIPSGDIDELGRIALVAFETDKVHLFQRKIHDREYQYIAMKRSNYGRRW